MRRVDHPPAKQYKNEQTYKHTNIQTTKQTNEQEQTNKLANNQPTKQGKRTKAGGGNQTHTCREQMRRVDHPPAKQYKNGQTYKHTNIQTYKHTHYRNGRGQGKESRGPQGEAARWTRWRGCGGGTRSRQVRRGLRLQSEPTGLNLVEASWKCDQTAVCPGTS